MTSTHPKAAYAALIAAVHTEASKTAPPTHTGRFTPALGYGYAAANSLDNAGCAVSRRSKQSTAPGGTNRPCSQSRSVAAGVPMRAAKSACDIPSFARVLRTNNCSAVVTRPVSVAASRKACRNSGKPSPASNSIAFAIFSMSMMCPCNVAIRNVFTLAFGVDHDQQ